jgi:uncharacterized protein (DUF433 family)
MDEGKAAMVKAQIKSKEVLHDIRSGVTHAELKQKYRLTDKGLKSLFKKLIEAGLITQAELEDR